MQKNYRDFTVGELIDMGLNVEVIKHGVTKEEGEKLTGMFENAKRSTHDLKSFTIYKAWKSKFTATFFSQ